MSEKLVTIASYNQVVEAYLAKARLESEDIEVFILNEDMSWLYSYVVSVELQVKESEVKRAKEILESD